MNVDIDRMRANIKSFQYLNETIYMPMFDERMNRLYREDIALFELKQYGRYIKTFHEEVKENLYGVLPYQMMFTSCLYISGDEHQFTLYHGDLHRLYFIDKFTCKQTLSLCPDKVSPSIDVLEAIAQSYHQQDEEAIAHLCLKHDLIDDKLKKKVEKYLQKHGKKK